MSNQQNIEKLESALGRLKTNESKAYFLVYDTKGNARASVKYICLLYTSPSPRD